MNEQHINNLLGGILNVALALRRTIESLEPGESVRKLSEEEWIELYILAGFLQKNVQQIRQELSIFEATETIRMARLFDRLAQDPDLEFIQATFPWTRVKRREIIPSHHGGKAE